MEKTENSNSVNVIIRDAVDADAEGIVKVMQEAFTRYLARAGTDTVEALDDTPEEIIEDIASKIVLVAELDGKIIGSVRVEKKGNIAYLVRFGVADGHQKLGIGRLLMEEVDKRMIASKVKRLYLHTATKFADTVRFYYGHGFYILAVNNDDGYPRGLFVKEY